ncbi:hypothetical protein D3C79_772380 [compost metagenome]
MLPGAGAHGPFELQRVAHLQGRQGACGEQPAAEGTNMKHQPPLVLRWQVGDGETAAVAVGQAKPQVLAGAYLEGLRGLQHQFGDIHAEGAFAQHMGADLQGRRVH